MRMDTDRLIRTLAADNAHRERPVGFVLAHCRCWARCRFRWRFFWRATASGPDVRGRDAQSVLRPEVSGDAGAGDLGDRHQPASVAARSHAASAGRGCWLIPAGLVALGIAGEMMMPQRLPMMTRLVGIEFAGLHQRHPAAVAAAAGRRAVRHAPRRAGAARGRRRIRRAWCRRDWRRRCTPRTAPTIHRCSWRPGTRSPTCAGDRDRRAGGIEGAAVFSPSVVPANAGTHNHRGYGWASCCRRLLTPSASLTTEGMGPGVRRDDGGVCVGALRKFLEFKFQTATLPRSRGAMRPRFASPPRTARGDGAAGGARAQ